MKDNELDDLFRNALHDMEGVPPQAKNWDREDTFGKIQRNLNGNQGQNRYNFFDLAAAIVLTLTAVTYLFSFLIAPEVQKALPGLMGATEKTHEELLEPTEKTDKREFLALTFDKTKSEALAKLEKDEEAQNESINIESKALQVNTEFSEQKLVAKVKEKAAEPIDAVPQSESKIDLQLPFSKKPVNVKVASNKLQISLPVGIAYTAGTIAPTASVNASINLKEASNFTTQASLGLSAYGLMEKRENEGLRISPAIFAETSFGVTSNKDQFVSGHAFGVGYQLNEIESIDGNAIKLNYTISIKKRLRVAAEALVSEGMSKIHPGIKLTFI